MKQQLLEMEVEELKDMISRLRLTMATLLDQNNKLVLRIAELEAGEPTEEDEDIEALLAEYTWIAKALQKEEA